MINLSSTTPNTNLWSIYLFPYIFSLIHFIPSLSLSLSHTHIYIYIYTQESFPALHFMMLKWNNILFSLILFRILFFFVSTTFSFNLFLLYPWIQTQQTMDETSWKWNQFLILMLLSTIPFLHEWLFFFFVMKVTGDSIVFDVFYWLFMDIYWFLNTEGKIKMIPEILSELLATKLL